MTKNKTNDIQEEILKEIHDELEKGINRNDILPLDWAMDRIEPIIIKGIEKGKLQRQKEIIEIVKNIEPHSVDDGDYEEWDKWIEQLIKQIKGEK